MGNKSHCSEGPLAYFGNLSGGRADRAADRKKGAAPKSAGGSKRLRPSQGKRWAAKPPTFSDGLPGRKRAASTFKSDGSLFVSERVSTRVSSCPTSNKCRLSYLTVYKFRIVVEARRKRARIVRNLCAPVCGHRSWSFGRGSAQL